MRWPCGGRSKPNAVAEAVNSSSAPSTGTTIAVSHARRASDVTGGHPAFWDLSRPRQLAGCPGSPGKPCLTYVLSVGARGFEPLTSSVSRKRSPPELSARAPDPTVAWRGGDRNRTGVRGFAGHCLTTRPPRRRKARVPRARVSLPCDRNAGHARSPAGSAYARAWTRRSTCPECGSDEIRPTTRKGDIHVVVCGVCDWASDPRIGRPPADRSKNFTLRRLIAASKQPRRTGGGPRIEMLAGAPHDSRPGPLRAR